MSIKTNIDDLPWETRQKIDSELKIKIEDKFGFGQTRYIFPYDVEGDDIRVPFAYGAKSMKISRPERSIFPGANMNFEGALRDEQKQVKKEAVKILNGNGSVLLSMYCGFGKTITSINIAASIGFKTLIIVNKIVLMKQWEDSIKRFCPSATIQKVTAKSKKTDCDFYIMNAINVEKMGSPFFADIGTVVVDECHLIMAETLSRSLQNIFPRYLIGLTATPYRPDGLDKLLEFYFGKKKIIRKLWREHTAYKVKTGFKPTIELANNGRVNWGVVLDSQANNVERNEMIIRIIQHFSERTFLVLVKRVSQGEYIINRLNELGEDVTSLIGSKQDFCVESRILVGTCSKVGTGFDHPRLDTMILAADVEEYFIQYLGRCMRTKDVDPLIFDLVDDYSILNKHFNTRREIYQDHGGTVKNFNPNTLTES
jgi:superfamily II DNA or RNA helicase